MRSHDGGRGIRDSEHGVSPVIGLVLLFGIVIAVAAVAGAGFVSFGDELPEETPPSAGFDLEVNQDDGKMEIVPTYMSGNTELLLKINGKTAYEWTGDNATESRTVTCLKRNDSVRVVSASGDRQYTAFEKKLDYPLRCNLDGVGKQFAFAKVGDREVPVADQDYSFDISIDPDGPDSVKGDRDIPATNPWNIVYRYDRTVEGLEAPVYVITFADNVGSCCGLQDASYDSEPPSDLREETTENFEVESDGNLDIQAARGPEPTDDTWIVFQPGCEESTFKFAGEAAGYDNQILLDGEVIIPNTNTATDGEEFTADGVECI
jgi:FlaG/FlaF family flagellin (archaellin)